MWGYKPPYMVVYGESDSPTQANGARLRGMWAAAFKHAWERTWAKRGGSAVVAVIGLAAVYAGYWLLADGEPTWDRVVTAELALVGLGSGLLAAFLWNLALAPYRIERDKRRELEDKVGAQPAISYERPRPNMPIKDLFLFINPAVFDADKGTPSTATLDKVSLAIQDAASLGDLSVWGRPLSQDVVAELVGEMRSRVEISNMYWENAELDLLGIFHDESERAVHAKPLTQYGQRYTDLQVSRLQAEKIWPEVPAGTVMQVGLRLSIYGVESVRDFTGFAKVTVRDENPAYVEVDFHRPITRDFIVTVDGDEQVHRKIISKTNSSVLLEIRGSSINEFDARLTVSVSGEAPKKA